MTSDNPIITAPWTEDQVAALNACQASGLFHPFTCGNHRHQLQQTLIAELDGWHCPDTTCDYTQDWAMATMSDRQLLARTARTREMMFGHVTLPADTPPALAELARYKNILAGTEHDLALTRAENAELHAQLATEKARTQALRQQLRNLEKIRRHMGRDLKPEMLAGECDAVWVSGRTGYAHIQDHFLPEGDIPEGEEP